MKYCEHCGHEVNPEAVVCIHCGCAVRPAMPLQQQIPMASAVKSDDRANAGLILVSVLFPIIGLILWAIEKDDSPRAAHAYGKAALITVCVEIGLVILLLVIVFSFIGSLM